MLSNIFTMEEYIKSKSRNSPKCPFVQKYETVLHFSGWSQRGILDKVAEDILIWLKIQNESLIKVK